MEVSHDELAGVVDLFGALTRGELREALSELAFRRGEEPPAVDDAIGDALAGYYLVEFGDESLLAPGPAAFPTLPEGAGDLPHIMDVEPRTVDRQDLAAAAEKRFRARAARAAAEGDDDRIARLLDVSYDLEAWGPVSLDDARERLDDAG